ncbi:MAG: NAD-dependent epimerase/dehydratase family protein [Bdellovibrionales bacterium]|nr:NAD-dependent epimerase/dehydratase family protein [Bdellovibrionales bacterium]
MKEKILVTGASGFVGSWITKFLIDQGHQVKVLARKNSDLSELNGLDYELSIGDVTDLESFNKAAKNVNSIFHLAGVVGYAKNMRPLMEKVNVEGTQNAIEVCKQNQLSRMLYFSSVTAIGAGFNKNQILNEDSPYNVAHLNLGYFETKHRAEQLVVNAVKKGEIDAALVNPATIYGPGDAKKGSRKTQLKVAQGRFPIYSSGGVNIISIHDLLPATYAAWRSGAPGERYILAGENITIKELFNIIAEEAGVSPPWLYLPNFVVHALGNLGDFMEKFDKKGPLTSENAWTSTMFHWFDNSKAKKELNLKPRPAKQAIAESIQWVKENLLINQ